MKRLPIVLNNRNFEVEVVPELSGNMVSVAIYEVTRPKWKIFRCSYRCYKTFWVTDYETITKGVVSMVQKFLEEEAFEKGIILKWKEFEQTTL
jgi:hypothetical protein